MALAMALTGPVAAQKADPKKAAKKKPVKIEKLACRLGTEDEHARIAVQLADGKVDSFAYYSKWKPRTCSMDVKRDDAFSKWEDTGNTTIVTLTEEKGAFLIDHSPGRYHFIFRDIDRMRYCGMEGKVNGTLTITRGRPQCQVTGVMDREMPEIRKPEVAKPAAATPEVAKPATTTPDVARPEAIPDLKKAAAALAEEKKAAAPEAAAPAPAKQAPESKPVAAVPAPAKETPQSKPVASVPASPAVAPPGPAAADKKEPVKAN